MRRSLLSATVLVALLASATATGGERALRTVERTFECSTLRDEWGQRSIAVAVEPRSAFDSPALSVWTIGKKADVEPLVRVLGTRELMSGPGLMFDPRRCRIVSHSFALSRVGLSRSWTAEPRVEKCGVGRRVLVRVRAQFTEWRGWTTPHPGGMRLARGTPVVASMAIRAVPIRAPVAYLLLNHGRTTLVAAEPPVCGLT